MHTVAYNHINQFTLFHFNSVKINLISNSCQTSAAKLQVPTEMLTSFIFIPYQACLLTPCFNCVSSQLPCVAKFLHFRRHHQATLFSVLLQDVQIQQLYTSTFHHVEFKGTQSGKIILLHSEMLPVTAREMLFSTLLSKQKGERRFHTVCTSPAASVTARSRTLLMHQQDHVAHALLWSQQSMHAPPQAQHQGTARAKLQPERQQAGTCIQRAGRRNRRGPAQLSGILVRIPPNSLKLPGREQSLRAYKSKT